MVFVSLSASGICKNNLQQDMSFGGSSLHHFVTRASLSTWKRVCITPHGRQSYFLRMLICTDGALRKEGSSTSMDCWAMRSCTALVPTEWTVMIVVGRWTWINTHSWITQWKDMKGTWLQGESGSMHYRQVSVVQNKIIPNIFWYVPIENTIWDVCNLQYLHWEQRKWDFIRWLHSGFSPILNVLTSLSLCCK